MGKITEKHFIDSELHLFKQVKARAGMHALKCLMSGTAKVLKK